MSNSNTIIKISRSKYIEESLEVALIRLDTMMHYKGTPVMINYYTSDLHDSFDTVFASGVKDGVGRDCYRILSLRQDNIIWGAGDYLPDVSNLVHGEKYLYKDSSDQWWLVQIAEDGRTRKLLTLPETPTTYECLEDGCKWVVSEDRKARRVNDIYSQDEIDELFDIAMNKARYVQFENLTPTNIEQIRGFKGDQGDKGDQGPMGLQGLPGLRGYNGTVENFVVLSESEYQGLVYKDPYKFYYTYDDEEEGGEDTDFVAYVDGNTLVIVGSVDENTLSINPSFASYDSDSNTLSVVSSIALLTPPTFSPIAGTYDGEQTIEIINQSPGASIRYTLDYTEPTESSLLYTGPITLDATGTIKAKAFNSGATSRTITSRYDLLFGDTVETPVITPAGGSYNTPQEVSITCSTGGALIRYTLDGSEPNEASTVYMRPITVSDITTILRARGFKARYNASQTVNGIFEIGSIGIVSKPEFSISSGTYYTPQTVIIYSQTPGAVIRYTLDGSIPTPASSMYTSPIVVSDNKVIKAKAYLTGMTSSNVNTLEIIITDDPTPPTPTPGGDDIEVNGNTINDNLEGDRVVGNTWIVLSASVQNKTLIF